MMIMMTKEAVDHHQDTFCQSKAWQNGGSMNDGDICVPKLMSCLCCPPGVMKILMMIRIPNLLWSVHTTCL